MNSPKLSETKKLAGLDHLRALAIILVFLFHYRLFAHPTWIETIGEFGWTGVDLFFVLSGYLISSQLFVSISQNEKIVFTDFFIRRFFRIIPAYLTVVAIYFCLPAFREREALSPLWRFLTFTQNFGLDLREHGTFSHAWSLCIEEQFYLLLPLTLIALQYFGAERPGGFLLLFLFGFGFWARIYSWYHFISPLIDTDGFGLAWYKYIYYPTYNRLDGLLFGISIAALFQFRPQIKKRISKYGNAVLLAGIMVLAGAYLLCIYEHTFSASIFGFPAVSLGYGLLVMAAISPACFLYKFSSRATTNIATLSYALYLVHKGVIHVVQTQFVKLGIETDGNIVFVLSIIFSIAGALALNKIVEKPFLALKEKILKART